MNTPENFWNFSSAELLQELNSSAEGISDEEAARRKSSNGEKKPRSPFLTDLILLLRQFKNPLALILIFAVILSSILGEYTNSFIIFGIILLSGLLGFWQERNANHAVEKLRARVQVKVTVKRNGNQKEILADKIVPGDIILLNAGDIIPADCILIESKDLHVNESALTGESFPSEKEICELKGKIPLAKRKNSVFKGTNVMSGSAVALAVLTEKNTELGKISSELEKNIPPTNFEIGIKKFGYMLMYITLILFLLILLLNMYFKRPAIDSFLFALALAVGMTPELLPAIVTITLSAGAERMAKKKVVVKKLSAIQNLGAVNVFCSDKTGTLTEGIIKVDSAVNIEGEKNEKVLLYAYLNAKFETSFSNPIDRSIREIKNIDANEYKKFDEVPYDFSRKRLSVVAEKNNKHIMITKGALKNILEICSRAEITDEKIVFINEVKEKIQKKFEEYSTNGFRIIGICYKDVTGDPIINSADENEMIFLGFILLLDPPKENVSEAIQKLRASGINLKLITGDNKFISAYIGEKIGIEPEKILTGSELQKISGQILIEKIKNFTIFAEVEPEQKEKIVQTLRQCGNVVGFIGDGINDVAALKAADVGISVDTATDVAKETADIVFLQRDLNVLRDGVMEGRKTFANIQKYIFMATSANFGNMFSVAGASLLVPFLPLLPKQILLTNFLTDLPEMTISSDNVDGEMIQQPHSMNINFIKRFMIVFGIISSIFDFLTFGVLIYFLKATPEEFRTGWFIESVISASTIVLIVRTRKPFYKSMPGKFLLLMTLIVILFTTLIPFTPLYKLFDFTILPIRFFPFLLTILLLYILTAETVKKIFFRKISK